MNSTAPVSRMITDDGMAVDLRRYLGRSILWGTLMGGSLAHVGTWAFTFRDAQGRELRRSWIPVGSLTFAQAVAAASRRARELGAVEIEVEP